MGRAASVLALALSLAACEAGADSSAGGDGRTEHGKSVPATPVPVDTAKRTVVWTDLENKPHELLAAPVELARGSAADLKGVRLGEDLKGKVPYYLTLSYSNKGATRLERPSPERDFLIASADGQPGKAVSVFSSGLSHREGPPEECFKGAPDAVKPGGKATVCQVFMMPPGLTPAAVSHVGRDSGGGESDPVIWKAGAAQKGGKAELPDGTLPLKQSARSAMQDSKRRNVRVEAAAQSVRKGDVADLARFRLDAESKKRVPYYVTVEYRNRGEHDLLPRMNSQTELRSVSGRPARRLSLIDFGGDGVAQCPQARPDGMVRPKASVRECSVFMLPKTDSPAALVFTGEGKAAKTVIWQVR